MVINMAKNAEKKLRMEKARKKAKLKKVLIIFVCIIIVAGFVTIGIISANRQKSAETYSNGTKTVRLFGDGKFSASLAHGESRSGTYKKSTADGVTTVTFTNGGKEEIGFIINGELHIPDDWDDGHGHGTVLQRK